MVSRGNCGSACPDSDSQDWNLVLPNFRGGYNIYGDVMGTDLCVNLKPDSSAYTKSLRNASTTMKTILSNFAAGGSPCSNV